MSHATGIELGPTSCVLVRARRGTAGIGGVRVVERSAGGPALVAALRAARFAGQLPRRARVVSWELSPSAAQDDPATESVARLLSDAGFRIEAVITPGEALARLAATSGRMTTDSPVAWVSIHTHGAAIAIVRRSQLLYSRIVTWKYDPAAPTPREQLLQRYLVIAHLAPELQRGIAVVRNNVGSSVDTVVTCGDFPELRALTLPLEEELGLAVETLDATPANRLAGVAALMPVSSWRPVAKRVGIGTALVLAVLSLGGYAWSRTKIAPAAVRTVSMQPAGAASENGAVPNERQRVEGTVGSFGSTQEKRKSQAISASRPRRALPAPPQVTSILIAGDRKLAMMGGSIVVVGDRVGPRTVVGIGQHSVALRDPSGAQIAVELRPSPR
jgi:hypothetical protein